MGERTRKTAKMNDFILAEASFAKRNWSFRFFEEKNRPLVCSYAKHMAEARGYKQCAVLSQATGHWTNLGSHPLAEN